MSTEPLQSHSPAIANILIRLTTGEGWQNLYLRPRLGRAWRVWILACLGPVVLTLLGTILFFVLFPDTFDSSLSSLEQVKGGFHNRLGAQTRQLCFLWRKRIFVLLTLGQ